MQSIPLRALGINRRLLLLFSFRVMSNFTVFQDNSKRIDFSLRQVKQEVVSVITEKVIVSINTAIDKIRLTMKRCVRCEGVEPDWNGFCWGVGIGPS